MSGNTIGDIRKKIIISLFMLATVVGCSSAKELEGHWKHTHRNDVYEYEITSKTVTYSFHYYSASEPGVSTKPYEVFEKGQSYIVLEIGRESKELVRFDLISEDKILVKGKVFIRVQ